jgi:hypothetical protein
MLTFQSKGFLEAFAQREWGGLLIERVILSLQIVPVVLLLLLLLMLEAAG